MDRIYSCILSGSIYGSSSYGSGLRKFSGLILLKKIIKIFCGEFLHLVAVYDCYGWNYAAHVDAMFSSINDND